MSQQKRLYVWGSLIGSGLGALLLFATTFMEWRDRDWVSYYYEDVVNIGTPILGIGVIACGLMLLICFLFSLMLIRNPAQVSSRTMFYCFLLSLLEVILVSAWLAISVSVYEAESVASFYWYTGTGFYGGLIGGILGVIFYHLMRSRIKAG